MYRQRQNHPGVCVHPSWLLEDDGPQMRIVLNAAEKGERGPKGEQGERGERGEKGERGDSGVIAPTSGLFALVGDEFGNLWAHYNGASEPPAFEVDADGNIFYIIEQREGEIE